MTTICKLAGKSKRLRLGGPCVLACNTMRTQRQRTHARPDAYLDAKTSAPGPGPGPGPGRNPVLSRAHAQGAYACEPLLPKLKSYGSAAVGCPASLNNI